MCESIQVSVLNQVVLSSLRLKDRLSPNAQLEGSAELTKSSSRAGHALRFRPNLDLYGW